MSSLKFDSARLWGISETEILETWSGGTVANKQSKKPGYKVTSIQQCGNNRGGDMKLNYESWCDACGALWTAVRNCCCGEEVTIITRSWQSSQDHGNHHKIMAIIRRLSPSSQDHGNHQKIIGLQSSGHLVCDDYLCHLLLGRRRKIWYTHIFKFLRRNGGYYLQYLYFPSYLYFPP